MVRYYPWNLAPDRLIRKSFSQGVQKSSRDALPPPLKKRQLKRARFEDTCELPSRNQHWNKPQLGALAPLKQGFSCAARGPIVSTGVVARQKELRLGSFKHDIFITHPGWCKINADYARETGKYRRAHENNEEGARCHQ